MDYFTRTTQGTGPGLTQPKVQNIALPSGLVGKASPGEDQRWTSRTDCLGEGVYCEIELGVVPSDGKGRADLLSLVADACEITRLQDRRTFR